MPHKITHYGRKNPSRRKFSCKSDRFQWHRYLSGTKEKKFPEPLTSLFTPESINFPEDKIKPEGELQYQSYNETHSQNDYNNLYEKTKEQSPNPILMHHRAERITASIAGEVYKTNVDITSQCLLNKIMQYTKSRKTDTHSLVQIQSYSPENITKTVKSFIAKI